MIEPMVSCNLGLFCDLYTFEGVGPKFMFEGVDGPYDMTKVLIRAEKHWATFDDGITDSGETRCWVT